MRRAFGAILAMGLATAPLSSPASAQTPSAAEIAGYRDLFGAGQTGDVSAIERVAAAGAAMDAREGNDRTALKRLTPFLHADTERLQSYLLDLIAYREYLLTALASIGGPSQSAAKSIISAILR